MIRVELGNVRPLLPHGEPCVTYIAIHDEVDSHTPGANGAELFDALQQRKNLPGHEAFRNVVHRDGLWHKESKAPPVWVWSDNEDFERILSEAFGCPRGRPGNLEMSYHTRSGPPGVGGQNH